MSPQRPPIIVFLADGEKGEEVARLIHEQWERKNEEAVDREAARG